MVDSNAIAITTPEEFRAVQIPLWSIVTWIVTPWLGEKLSSNSSMVDSNHSFSCNS